MKTGPKRQRVRIQAQSKPSSPARPVAAAPGAPAARLAPSGEPCSSAPAKAWRGMAWHGDVKQFWPPNLNFSFSEIFLKIIRTHTGKSRENQGISFLQGNSLTRNSPEYLE